MKGIFSGQRASLAAGTAALLLAAGTSSGAVVVSEALANEVGSDTLGEWIEIFNNGSTAVDLSNYKIGDEETNGGTGGAENIYQFPSGASIAPGEVLVIAASATRFNTVYGFLPDFEWTATDSGVPDVTGYTTWDSDGSVAQLANGNDQALLVDGTDTIVDIVSWNSATSNNNAMINTSGGAPADGQSFERINAYVDTDTGADWQFGPTSDTAANRSTPGVANVPEPAALSLLGVAGLAGLRRRRRA